LISEREGETEREREREREREGLKRRGRERKGETDKRESLIWRGRNCLLIPRVRVAVGRGEKV
jgi:hypothetical protein